MTTVERRWLTVVASLLLIALSVLAGSGFARAAPVTVASARVSVTVVGIPDLQWADIDAGTPALRRFADRAALGVLVVKATGARTSALDGWLTLSAGNRAAAAPADSNSSSAPLTAMLTAARRSNARLSFGAVPGALAAAIRADGMRITGTGGNGAMLAASTPARPLPGSPQVRLVEDDGLLATVPGESRRAAAQRVDRDIARYLEVPRTAGSVIVVGVSDGPTSGPRLHVAMAAGAGFRAGVLRSASTGRAPFVQLIDVAPTVLGLLRQTPPSSMVGARWQVVPAAGTTAATLRSFADIQQRALAGRRWSGPFQTALVWAVVLLTLAAAGIRRHARYRAALAAVAVAVAAVPVMSYVAQLLPWWRPGSYPLLLLPLVALAALAMAAVAAGRRVGTWAGVLVVSATTAGVLLLDLITGSTLQQAAVLGDSPLLAGRFVGAGNICTALLGTSALLMVAALPSVTQRRPWVLGATAVIGVITLGVDGAPGFGNDAGGLLSLAPAFAVAVLRCAGWRLRSRWTLLLAGVAVLPLLGVAAYDYAQPAARRTHLGRFVGGLLHGGTAGTEVHRRLAAAVASLWHSPYVLLLAALGYLLWRGGPVLVVARQRLPGLLVVLPALAVFAVIGGIVNDSGVAVPGAALSLALPLVIALGCHDSRDREDADTDQPGAAEPMTRSGAPQRRQ